MNPQAIYVPVHYNPQVVYVRRRPPPSTGTVVAAAVISFGVGIAVGAMFSNNNYCPYPRWGYARVYSPHWRSVLSCPLLLIRPLFMVVQRFARLMATGLPGTTILI